MGTSTTIKYNEYNGFVVNMPNIRVDDETIDLIKRVQGFYLFTAGERLSQGVAVKRVLEASIDELTKESS